MCLSECFKYEQSPINDARVIFFFFFFQAEDGIRDLTVTGVQTCALPISTARISLAGVLRKMRGKKAAVSDFSPPFACAEDTGGRIFASKVEKNLRILVAWRPSGSLLRVLSRTSAYSR